MDCLSLDANTVATMSPDNTLHSAITSSIISQMINSICCMEDPDQNKEVDEEVNCHQLGVVQNGQKGLEVDPYVLKFRQEKLAALQRDKLVSALAISEAVPFHMISEEIVMAFGRKSPISMLMEHAQYARSKVNFVEIGQPEGPDHKPLLVTHYWFKQIIFVT